MPEDPDVPDVADAADAPELPDADVAGALLPDVPLLLADVAPAELETTDDVPADAAEDARVAEPLLPDAVEEPDAAADEDVPPAHTQSRKAEPSALQTCAPDCPLAHTHAALAFGVHAGSVVGLGHAHNSNGIAPVTRRTRRIILSLQGGPFRFHHKCSTDAAERAVGGN